MVRMTGDHVVEKKKQNLGMMAGDHASKEKSTNLSMTVGLAGDHVIKAEEDELCRGSS